MTEEHRKGIQDKIDMYQELKNKFVAIHFYEEAAELREKIYQLKFGQTEPIVKKEPCKISFQDQSLECKKEVTDEERRAELLKTLEAFYKELKETILDKEKTLNVEFTETIHSGAKLLAFEKIFSFTTNESLKYYEEH